jgi:hypothetical protein
VAGAPGWGAAGAAGGAAGAAAVEVEEEEGGETPGGDKEERGDGRKNRG